MTGIIYCAENNINGKVYIGQTIRTLRERKRKHFNVLKLDKSKGYFQRALLKYNKDDWNWTVIQEYECDKSKMVSVLNKAEMHYIDAFDSFKNGYNMTPGGGGTFGYIGGMKNKKHSEEALTKMRKPHNGYTITDKVKNKPYYKRGFNSEQSKEKNRIASTKMWEDPNYREKTSNAIKASFETPESRMKLTMASKKRIQVLDTRTGIIYPSLRNMEKSIGIDRKSYMQDKNRKTKLYDYLRII